MKILFLFLLSFKLMAVECIPEAKDFITFYELEKDAPILGLTVSVSAKDADKLLCSSESCGSGGCECALYVPINKCLTRVLDFRGSHKVLDTKTKGMPDIQVSKRGDAIAPNRVTIYKWNEGPKRYEKQK